VFKDAHGVKDRRGPLAEGIALASIPHIAGDTRELIYGRFPEPFAGIKVCVLSGSRDNKEQILLNLCYESIAKTQN
jgi:hypothetical protein